MSAYLTYLEGDLGWTKNDVSGELGRPSQILGHSWLQVGVHPTMHRLESDNNIQHLYSPVYA